VPAGTAQKNAELTRIDAEPHSKSVLQPNGELLMKRIAIFSTVLMLAACATPDHKFFNIKVVKKTAGPSINCAMLRQQYSSNPGGNLNTVTRVHYGNGDE
jgi:hypothetical protein